MTLKTFISKEADDRFLSNYPYHIFQVSILRGLTTKSWAFAYAVVSAHRCLCKLKST